MKNVYVVGADKYYANFINNFKLTDSLEEADIVIFTGGEDVDPSLYNRPKCSRTYSNLNRDLTEKTIFESIKPNQLVIGICRGSQFLCVMNGGILVQDVSSHAIRHTHEINELSTNKQYDITSTHHQMQYPFNIPGQDWTCLFDCIPRSSYYDGLASNEYLPYEPEIVLYHKKNFPICLAIQGHPEYMRLDAPIVIRLNEIIDELLTNIRK